MQWADTASLDLIQYAARRWAEEHARALVIITVRSEALATNSELAEWMDALARDVTLTRIPLQSLTAQDTFELIEALARRGEDVGKFSRELFEDTGGQPLFILETLKLLLEREMLKLGHTADGAWAIDFEHAPRDVSMLRGLIAPRVRDVIRARVARLSPNATALLAAGAVLGDDFDFDELRVVAQLNENDALLAFDELLSSRVLQETREHYAFAHDKIRDVVYTEAGDARRRIFHRRALEFLAPTRAQAELAHHAFAARVFDDAFRYSAAAGDEALRVFAVRDAIGQYERARTLVNQELKGRLATAKLKNLYMQLGRAYELVDEPVPAEAIYQEFLQLVREANDTASESLALHRLATLAAHGRDLIAATRFLEQAVRAAEQSGDKMILAETEWNLAQIGYYTWQRDTALAHGERALGLARELGLRELEARSLNAISYAHWMLNQWEDAEAAAQSAREIYAALGNRAMETDCLCVVAEAQLRLGKPRAAMETANVARAISREIANAEGEIGSEVRLALGLADVGEFEAARDASAHSVTTARTVNDPNWTVLGLALLGAIYRDLEKLDHARAAHHEAYDIARTRTSPLFRAMLAAQLCADYATMGDWEKAYAYALEALVDRDVTLMDGGPIHWYAIEALIRAHEVERAEQEVRQFDARIGSVPRYRIPLLRSMAVLAQARGDINQATVYLNQAAALAQELGLLGEKRQIQIG